MSKYNWKNITERLEKFPFSLISTEKLLKYNRMVRKVWKI